MKILVVGAMGRTGLRVVQEAARRGHGVRALSRSASADRLPAGVEVIAGSALDEAVVSEAVAGVDAVVVTLSMVRSNPNNPWSSITTPADLHRQAAALLTSACETHGVERYLSMSAHGVGNSRARAGWAFMGLVNASNIGVAYRALATAEDVIAASGLRWTVVRPTRLTDGAAVGWHVSADRLSSRASIAREDVARCLVDWCGANEHVGERVSITTTS